MPGGLGITDKVEPMAGPPLAIARAGQEPVDELFVSIAIGIGQKSGDILGGGGQTGQVEAQPAYQSPPVGLGPPVTVRAPLAWPE